MHDGSSRWPINGTALWANLPKMRRSH